MRCFLASLPRASVLGPGIFSASLKNRWSSTWQKYCERNISCVETIFAPDFAACSMRRSWFFKLISGVRGREYHLRQGDADDAVGVFVAILFAVFVHLSVGGF